MIEYVLGFCFTEDRSQVLLIHKNKEDWQLNKVNGIGGRIYSAETDRMAMSREFMEEADIEIGESDWEYTFTLTGPGWWVRMYRTFTDKVVGYQDREMDEGRVFLCAVDALPNNIVNNLKWLVPFHADEFLFDKEWIINVNSE